MKKFESGQKVWVKTMDQALVWINELSVWRMTYSDFLREMTVDEFGNKRSTHERLLKAESSIWRMIRQQTLSTNGYLIIAK